MNLSLFVLPIKLMAQNNEKIKVSKISPHIDLGKKSIKKHNISVQVKNNLSFETWMKNEFSELKFEKSNYSNIYYVKGIEINKISKLINSENVKYIDVSSRKAKEERLNDKSDLTYNKIEPVHLLYPDYTGKGLTFSIKENLFDVDDLDFKGRIKSTEYSSGVLSLHATMMTTLIAGAGNNGPKGKGVAWEAEITSSNFASLFPDDGALLVSNEVSVQNHSYGVDLIENYYGLESQQYDLHCNSYPELFHVFSSGNRGTETSVDGIYSGIDAYANLTGQFKTSKNTICVGEIDSYGNIKTLSSRGPAFDGRVKPELVAYGFNGSSESAALVSGISLLVQNAYKEYNNDELPSSSLIKSILINSADDVGRAEVDFESGFGSVDALGSIKTVEENRYIIDTIIENQEKIFTITVPENIFKLKLTIVWNDIASQAGVEKALVNDLDLELYEVSSGTIWEPWVLNHYPHIDSISKPAIRTKDHINNVEQITVEKPAHGEYQLKVYGTSVQSNQIFSIAYEYEGGFEWIYPLKDNKLEADGDVQIRWQWDMDSEIGDVEYKIIGSESWEVIAESVNLSNNNIDWNLPEINDEVQIRIKTDTKEFLSDTFLVSESIDLSVGMNCEDETLLFWNQLSGVDGYEVYRLEEKFLKPLFSTSDTLFTLTGSEKDYYNYSVSPIINQKEGYRSKTINYSTQNVDCYFVSFIPQKLVTDTVKLNLELSSIYKLSTVNLERYDKGNYTLVQRINPVLKSNFVLFDDSPKIERNLYRVRLERNDFKEVVSQEEEVFFMPLGNVLIYPNPVKSNQEINIIDGEDGVSEVKIYDSSGKVHFSEETDLGMVKSISMDQFNAGIYFIELKSERGYKKIKKIIVLK